MGSHSGNGALWMAMGPDPSFFIFYWQGLECMWRWSVARILSMSMQGVVACVKGAVVCPRPSLWAWGWYASPWGSGDMTWAEHISCLACRLIRVQLNVFSEVSWAGFVWFRLWSFFTWNSIWNISPCVVLVLSLGRKHLFAFIYGYILKWNPLLSLIHHFLCFFPHLPPPCLLSCCMYICVYNTYANICKTTVSN